MRFVTLGMAIGIAFAGFVSAEENVAAGWADTNVRVVQEKLRDAGLYFGEIDGAYSSELAAALGRYQIRNGLPITGQLDEETSKALGAKPAVTTPLMIARRVPKHGGGCAWANSRPRRRRHPHDRLTPV